MDEKRLQEIDERRAQVLRDGTAAGALRMAADDVPELVAEVRRLTAALDAVTVEHAAALDAARREGAEGMRAKGIATSVWCSVECAVSLRDGTTTERIAALLEVADAAREMWEGLPPLDAPGGGS